MIIIKFTADSNFICFVYIDISLASVSKETVSRGQSIFCRVVSHVVDTCSSETDVIHRCA